MIRHENNLKASPYKAVITSTGDDCGMVGPIFMLQLRDNSLQKFLQTQIAEFLNDSVINSRTISSDVEKGLFNDFKNVLQYDGKVYSYTGNYHSKLNQLPPQLRLSYSEAKKQYSEIDELISKANQKSSLSQLSIPTFSPKDSQLIMMHEIGLTNSYSNKPVIGTYGAGPCIILGAYNSHTKQALLTHIDILVIVQSINIYLQNISGNSQNQINIFICGGQESTKQQVADLLKIINQSEQYKISYSNLIGNGLESHQLAIDSRTGEIFTNFDPKKLYHPKDFQAKNSLIAMQFAKSPIELSYEGTKDLLENEQPMKNLVTDKSFDYGSVYREIEINGDIATIKFGEIIDY